MSEYSNITKDYVIRTLQNYMKAESLVEYSFTFGITTLQAISMAISEEAKNPKINKTDMIISEIERKDDIQELKKISFFNTGLDYTENFSNIRNATSHLVENYDFFNRDNELNKFRFTCNDMKKNNFADIQEKELKIFFKNLYNILLKQ